MLIRTGILILISTLMIGQSFAQKKKPSRKSKKPAPIVLPTPLPTPTTGSGARYIPNEIEKSDGVVSKVIERAEVHFREGKLKFESGRREQARDEFDKAVDTTLNSGMDVRANARLQTYYLELVERIYRLEVPQQRTTPGSIINQQVDQNIPRSTIQNQRGNQQEPSVGFKDQKYEPSPLDELAKLILKPEGGNASTYSSKLEALKQPPTLRGFRLGMTLDEFFKRLAGVKVYRAYTALQMTDEYGAARVSFRPLVKLSRKGSDLEGVESVSAEFLDQRLTSIQLSYDSSVKWNSIDEFTTRVSEALGLPGRWDRSGYSTRYILGEGFVVSAELHAYQPSISVFIPQVKQVVEKRRAEREEKKRRAFKP